MPDSFDYTTGTNSENVRLLQALIDDAPEYTEETNSRNANILKSIINNTEYTDAPQSEIEELLLRLKAKIGGEIEVDELNVTENGTYDAGVNKAYNPVKVELPLNSKTITENGTYTASSDNLAGFNEVTVAVEGYAKKSIANTPTAIATFNASALPMPSLTVGIEAVQAGTGDPSPTNVRPFTGWSAVNVTRSGINMLDVQNTTFKKWRLSNNEFTTISDGNSNITFTVNNNDTISVTVATRYYGIGFKIEPRSVARVFSFANTTLNLALIDEYKTGSETIVTGSNGIIVIPANVGGFISIRFDSATDYTLEDLMIEIGEIATTYTPYTGTTYTTTLKDGQGNPMVCYGGTLSNENGVQSLDETMDKVDLGSLNWSYIADSDYTNGGYFRSEQYTNMSANTINILCDNYLPAGVQGKNAVINKYGASANNIIYTASSSNRLYVLDSAYTDPDQFKTYLQSTNAQLIYELATPQQIPQDSLSIASQSGTNNLWADSGDIQSGEYMEAL